MWLSDVLTVFDLSQVPDHHVSHGNLDDISFSHDGELLLLLNSTLKTSELLLFGPVVEGRDQNHTHHRQQDGGALDPAGVGFAFVLGAARRVAARWGRQSRGTEPISCFHAARLDLIVTVL